MVQLTSGTIGYSRVKKDEDFGINRKGEASLSFSIGENETPAEVAAAVLWVENEVFQISHRLLTKQFTAARAVELKAGPASAESVAVSPPASEVPAGSAPNDKEKLAAAAGVGAKAAAQFGQNAKPPRTPRKTAAAAIAEKANVVVSLEDDDPLGLSIVVPEEKPEPVTDAELGSATVAQNKKIQKPDAIRALIAEFAGAPPKQARDIPQERRHAYLTKLKTLE